MELLGEAFRLYGWYVTSFGFGRSDRQRTRSGLDPAYLVGGDVAWALRMGAHDVALRVEAEVPVHADEIEGSTDPVGHDSSTWARGYLRLTLEWTR